MLIQSYSSKKTVLEAARERIAFSSTTSRA